MPEAVRPEGDLEPVMRESFQGALLEAVAVVTAVTQAGGRAFLVGGCVRDLLLRKPSKDVDIEVYGLQPDHLEAVLARLGKVDKVGKSFGVLKLKHAGQEFDVSIPRREQKTGKGYKGFIATPDPTMTLADAGRRRDFTINAIALDLLTGHVFDPHGGVADLGAKILRAVDKSAFSEDPLRILRGAQFAARLQMSPDPETMRLMQLAKHELRDLPKERVHVEWRKLLTKGEDVARGLDVLIQSGALEVLHPELHAMSPDALRRSMDTLRRVVASAKVLVPVKRDAVCLAALLQYLDPDVAMRVAVEQFGAVKEVAPRVRSLVSEYPHVRNLLAISDTEGEVRRLAGRLRPATIEELACLDRAGTSGVGTAAEWLSNRAKVLGVHDGPTKPLLSGKHLAEMGVPEGPKVGAVIKHVLELQLDGHVRTVEDAKEAARRHLAGE